ncbi:MAG: hypothetical protein HY646_05925 [Acidobacteria bacterium]|nr:hypothetical protein [Acidobacteriota bacterium]
MLTLLMRTVLMMILLAVTANGLKAQTRDVLVQSTLTEGFGMGVNSSGGRTDWLIRESTHFRMAYPSIQQWGAVFITVGDPRDFPRPSQNFSAYRLLSVDMRGSQGSESLEVGVKDNTQADNGTETKIPVTLTNDWRTYHFSLGRFSRADISRLYVVIEFVFAGATAQTVDFRNVRYSLDDGTRRTFSISDRGGMSLSTRGDAQSNVTVGYGRITPDSGRTAPTGLAIFGFTQSNTLVSETAVPAAAAVTSGRIYLEVNGPVNTGLAIANPNNQSATISFFFTDSNGRDFGQGSTTIPANSQIGRFLNEPPFNVGASVSGTMTFNSSVPVAAIALRGFTNQRGEFLITTLPVLPLSSSTSGSLVLPHFADGGGWSTQAVLVNPTDQTLTGSVSFLSSGGSSPAAAITITVNGEVNSVFPYSIAPRSSRRLQTMGGSGQTLSGSVRITASGTSAVPSALLIFSFTRPDNAVTVSEAGVQSSRASTAFRMFSETSGVSGQTGSIRTGIAVANSSTAPTTLLLDVTNLEGVSLGLSTTLSVPASGQIAKFLDELISALPSQFVLRVTSSSAPVTLVGLRGRYSERADFLITTMVASDENDPASSVETFFPHIVDSGGYNTQLILFSGRASQQTSGQLRFLDQRGYPLNLQPQ